MSAFHLTESKSANRLAFEHYLRTGERLTSRQWRARYEQKFNPYHDRLGRFTTASGATATAGYAGARIQAARATAAPSRQARQEQVTRPVPDQRPVEASPGQHAGSSTSPRENGFQSRFILDRVESRTSNADKAWHYSREQIKCFFIDSEEQARLPRRAYEAAMRRAHPMQRKKLASAQSAWIKAKERKCRIYRLCSPEVAGTDEISEIYSCLGSESMDRIDWLERQYRSRRPGL